MPLPPLALDLVAELPAAEVRRSTARIDFGTPAARASYRGGWSDDWSAGGFDQVWGTGRASRLELELEGGAPVTLVLRCKPLWFPGAPVQSVQADKDR